MNVSIPQSLERTLESKSSPPRPTGNGTTAEVSKAKASVQGKGLGLSDLPKSPIIVPSIESVEPWIGDHRAELGQVDDSGAGGGKKRSSSRVSPHLSTIAALPPTKRVHHPHVSQRRPHSTNLRRKSSDDKGKADPLFFSDRPTSRPPLPYRMSSAESGSRLLGKGIKDETGGYKTLKLARGSAGVSSPSRSLGQRTPSGSGRSHFGLPRSKHSDERPKSQDGHQWLHQSGITELIDQDDRPTFILDLADDTLYEPGQLRILYANASLRAVHGVLDTISGASYHQSPGLAVATVFSDFKHWATSFVKNHVPMEVSLPAFTFSGAMWTCSILKKRFRVFRGIPMSPRTNLSSNPPSLGIPSTSPNNKDLEMTSTRTTDASGGQEEPQDYFGRAGASFAERMENNREEDAVPNPNKGLRISRLNTPLDLPPTNSKSDSSSFPTSSNGSKSLSRSPTNKAAEECKVFPGADRGFFDWTRMADSPMLPKHIQFAKSVDWASTSLGPISGWSSELRSMCNLIMASPHPAAMYWGPDFVAIYNEAYIYLAGQKHPQLMGQSYRDAWPEIWDKIEGVFAIATQRGESTMKEDDCLFIGRATTDGGLEEAWFDWSIIPLVGGNGSVVGLYNPAFEKTKRKVGERRTGTLQSVGERTSTAKDLKTFWKSVISGLEPNFYDVPFALLYSIGDEMDSDSQSSIHTTLPAAKFCVLEGSIGIPPDHVAAAPLIDLRDDNSLFADVFCNAALGDQPIVLSVEKGTLDPIFLEGITWRGPDLREPCSTAVCCPVQSTRNETLGYLVMGINSRRPYDDDYSTFIQMLSRQISTAMASVVLFEEEIRAGMKAKRRADIARQELSEKLVVQTQAVVETERKFTQMAKYAPVGIFIANSKGEITYRNKKWYEILKAPNNDDGTFQWMDAVKDVDKDRMLQSWSDLINKGIPMNMELRFKSSWIDQTGNPGDTWVLASGYPEKGDDGKLKQIFGSITDISQQKWAEHFEKRRMEEAVEMKRQQENFIDITSHEMRNPLSAILQCADEISSTLSNFRANDNLPETVVDIFQASIEAAGTISLCAQHQKRIVDDILTLSKLDSALLLVTPCDVMPRNVVQRALKMFEGEVQTADIELNFKIDASIPNLGVEWVKIDPSRVLQVLINLTTNAIKFTTTQEKRRINVTLGASLQRPSRDGPVTYFPTRSKGKDITKAPEWGSGEEIYLHFKVEDTGRGLSESEKKLLFIRFSQASPRTHVQYGGSGLGLFISRELVELQGGEIGVASKAGEGSTFAFYVKAKRSSTPADEMDEFPSPIARKTSAGHGLPSRMRDSRQSSDSSISSEMKPLTKVGSQKNLKILIVEDNLVNQKVLARQLRNLGILVHVANHGGECIEKLKETTYWKAGSTGTSSVQIDVILMDQEMPVMDGLTCTKMIREMERTGEVISHIPIIAVTANARGEQVQTALGVGMDNVVSKPFRIPDLIPKVEELVAKYPAP